MEAQLTVSDSKPGAKPQDHDDRDRFLSDLKKATRKLGPDGEDASEETPAQTEDDPPERRPEKP